MVVLNPSAVYMHVLCQCVFSFVQIFDGPNPVIEDLIPDRGNITIPVGKAVAQFTVVILDDQVLAGLHTVRI